MTHLKNTPLALIILDGFGYSEKVSHNAIALANTPNWDRLWHSYPHCLIEGSGTAVGLPAQQMGNSEVGHLNIGAGRVVQQDFTRIDSDINEGHFFQNPVLLDAINKAKTRNKSIHVLGLLSPGGVHSHELQIQALLNLVMQQQVQNVYLHAFLDGRDTPPKSAHDSLVKFQQLFSDYGYGGIASICGRFYAMDRDKRWDRIEQAYNMLTTGQTEFQADNAVTALENAYARGETDEFVQATCIVKKQQPLATINDGDIVIFMNYRADRARQLTRALVEQTFTDFQRQACPKLTEFVTLTEYADDLAVAVAYQPLVVNNVLGEVVSLHGLKQLRIAETEKYAHVTFFFNGGVETPLAGEKRVLIPSPKVKTYDLKPEMSAYELTDAFIQEINNNDYAMVICNFANADMVGHTGDLAAAIKAVEALDACLGKLVDHILALGGEVIITADHGNAECMQNEATGQPHTAHTTDPIPFLYIGRAAKVVKPHGALSDIAPTMLYLLNLPIPSEMTGQSLITVNA